MGIEILIAIVFIIFKIVAETNDTGKNKYKKSPSNYKRTSLNSQRDKKYNQTKTQNNYFSASYNPNKPETVNTFLKEIEEENGKDELTEEINKKVIEKAKTDPIIIAAAASSMKPVTSIEEPEVDEYEEVVEEVESFEEAKPVITSNPADKIKFTILTLVYVMYEDDGEFSRKEKKLVQSVVKVVGRRLTTKDKKELDEILDMRPNLDYLFMKVDDYNLSSDEVFSVVKELRKTVKSDKYSRIFSRIENRMTYEL